MKKWAKWSKKQKVITGVIVVGLAIGSGVGAKVYADNQYKESIEKSKKILSSEQASLDDLKGAIDALRDKENPNFLISDVSADDLTNIDKQLASLKSEHKSIQITTNEKLNKQVVTLTSEVSNSSNAIAYQIESQKAVNGLFTQDKGVAINGTTVNKDLSIIDDLTIAMIEKVVKETQNKDKLALIPKSTSKEMSWQQSITSLTDSATEQVKLIESVTKTVDSFYKDNKIVDTTDIKAVNEAETQANTIKNEKAKKELLDKIKAVKEVVSNKLKTEAENQAKSSGGKVVAQADGTYKVEQETSSNTTTNNNVTSNQGTTSQNDSYSSSANNNSSYSDNSSSYSNNTSSGSQSSGGSTYTPPATNNNGGSSSNSGGNSNSGSSNGSWSGTVEWTEGGVITGDGSDGGTGSNTWTGGEFDGSGIPEW